jgi:hypothetical protein
MHRSPVVSSSDLYLVCEDRDLIDHSFARRCNPKRFKRTTEYGRKHEAEAMRCFSLAHPQWHVQVDRRTRFLRGVAAIADGLIYHKALSSKDPFAILSTDIAQRPFHRQEYGSRAVDEVEGLAERSSCVQTKVVSMRRVVL